MRVLDLGVDDDLADVPAAVRRFKVRRGTRPIHIEDAMCPMDTRKALAAGSAVALDEIAGGLTDAECDSLLDIIRIAHSQGATIIWIEHVLHGLRRIATRLTVLHGGNIISSGPPDQVLADGRVKEVYLGV